MKKLLFLTDFSSAAKHAAEYGYQFAKQIKADIVLGNAIIVPAEVPQAGLVAWPLEDSETLLEDSEKELKRLKAHIEQNDHSETFRPAITFASEAGTVTNAVDYFVKSQYIDLILMGTHHHGGLSSFLFGDHCKNVIDSTNKPLLLIPPKAKFAPIKKIAFATDFKNPDDDLKFIYSLISLAKQLNAEILLTHVYDGKYQWAEFEHWIKNFMVELVDTANYPNIYYRMIKSAGTETGLDWLSEHGQVDLLTMVHRQHDFFNDLLHGSDTKKMAGHVSIPLLVFQD
ncbi:Nucleotide-binding universal stress protein, UspA family [Mucilaginibacter lappiensis]|uniref:Nucleotide-binding universal stress UspA family protein n=1 Tax=Mucilaginibacter lappiensis TaxID=354630 RepID=A0ABR6PTH9_9SPHI|nr:universal stress protein [Mucilaginibacter lappiensis]MBB6113049.1 nucleotide-binding universal stress UspA family protein [Mucilaginibacter lappiensis]SIS10972.1 Nucleotide-binding universal stress protein, UspA family [Mucilaginibacter lappiensis]